MGWLVAPLGGVNVVGKDGATADFLAHMFLIPERRLGVVVLINANRMLHVARLLSVAYNIVELLLGQQPNSIPVGLAPTLFYAAVLVAVVLQATGMARTIMLLRHWRGQPERGPQTRAQRALRFGLPLLLNLVWAATALFGVPALFGLPFAFGLTFVPDLFSVLLVSGVLAMVWAIVRTGLCWRLSGMRSEARGAPAIAVG